MQRTLAFGGENFHGGALGSDLSIENEDNLGFELDRFFDVVRDRKNGDVARREPGSHSGNEGVAIGVVEAAERFVEQEEAAVGSGEGAGERNAAAFSAREGEGHRSFD